MRMRGGGTAWHWFHRLVCFSKIWTFCLTNCVLPSSTLHAFRTWRHPSFLLLHWHGSLISVTTSWNSCLVLAASCCSFLSSLNKKIVYGDIVQLLTLSMPYLPYFPYFPYFLVFQSLFFSAFDSLKETANV